jgi:transcriptional regulator
MYVPASFRVDDRDVLLDFIDRYAFATLVTVEGGVPTANHLPLLLDRERDVLLGHVARANPQWRACDGVTEALAVFQGPHAYVSPSWYTVAPAVPTWNYAAVHVTGAPRAFDDEDRLADLLARLVAKYESPRAAPWTYDPPEDYHRMQLRAIVEVELPLTRIEGKFKLGQNRGRDDRLGTVAGLDAGDDEARALAAFTRRVAPP